jgi:NADH-quinone oxidoreductase subunit C
MTKNDSLVHALNTTFGDIDKDTLTALPQVQCAYGEVTMESTTHSIRNTLLQLRDKKTFQFDQMIDLCVVDYLAFGQSDWETELATEQGFSRGVQTQKVSNIADKTRFAVVYHLLSTKLNHRLRVKVFLPNSSRLIPSIHDIWKGANWFEREAYDLYGVLFEGHPDLRRILTDYGFIGHPFRKDFPLSGQVEMRYDATLEKVIYEPVAIEPRILVPKVIRTDHRYAGSNKESQ